jgi:hypothetical protein
VFVRPPDVELFVLDPDMSGTEDRSFCFQSQSIPMLQRRPRRSAVAARSCCSQIQLSGRPCLGHLPPLEGSAVRAHRGDQAAVAGVRIKQQLLAWGSNNGCWRGDQAAAAGVGIKKRLLAWRSSSGCRCGDQTTVAGVGIKQRLPVWGSNNGCWRGDQAAVAGVGIKRWC